MRREARGRGVVRCHRGGSRPRKRARKSRVAFAEGEESCRKQVMKTSFQRVDLGNDTDGGDEDTTPRSHCNKPLSLVAQAKLTVAAALVDARRNLSSLDSSPRDLWILFVLKLGDSYSYFAVSQVMVLYLHTEFGISDVEAGAAYGLWGVAITFWGLLCSVLNDALGVRRALQIGFALSVASYVLLAFATSRTFLYLILFVLLPLGNSLGIPMLGIGVKQNTNTANRGFAFGLFYAIMNLAAFVSGPVIDALTLGLGPAGLVLTSTSRFSANRCVVLSAALSSLSCLVVACTQLRGVPPTLSKDKGGQPQSLAERRAALWSLVSSPTFARFCALTLLLVNLNAVFRHLDATFPTFVVRTFGPDAPKGMLYSINPLIIMLLVPVVGATCTSVKNFDMIKWGGWLTALAPFCLAASVSIPGCVGMVVLLSLGEAVWSPRTYDYTYSVAPDGQEAAFSALASAPLFAAKVPVGLLSGWLLETFCPESGQKRGSTLWAIVGLVTLTSPLLISLLESRIREPDKAPASVAAGAGVDKGLELPGVPVLGPAGGCAASGAAAEAKAEAEAEEREKEREGEMGAGEGQDLGMSSHNLL